MVVVRAYVFNDLRELALALPPPQPPGRRTAMRQSPSKPDPLWLALGVALLLVGPACGLAAGGRALAWPVRVGSRQ
jgi:hypothetical protein